MKELYDLRDILEDELKEYGNKGELSAGTLDIVDKLTHTIKNLDKIIECDENGGYSGWYPYGYGYGYDGRSYEDRSHSSGNTGSMGYSRSRYSRRDGNGRYSSNRGYSSHGDMAQELRQLMNDAPNDQIRKDIQRLVEKVEQM